MYLNSSEYTLLIIHLIHPNRRDRYVTLTLLEKEMLRLQSCGYSYTEINGLQTKLNKYNKLASSGLILSDREADILKTVCGKNVNQELQEIEKSASSMEPALPASNDVDVVISQEDVVSQDMIEKHNENVVLGCALPPVKFEAGEQHMVELENFDSLELTFDKRVDASFNSSSGPSKRKILGTSVKYLPNCGLFKIKVGEYNLLAARHKILLKNKGNSFIQAYSQDSKDGRSMYNVILEKKVRRLKELSTRPSNSKLFWSVAWHEFMESKIYLVSCLNHVLPHWHRKMTLIEVIKIINETRELIKNKHAHIEIRRVYIPKPNGKSRPLGVPRISHRIYLHMINNLLSIYISGQVLINPNQHGFQPNKGTLSAWKQLISEVIESENIYEFDLVKFFDEIQVQAILDRLISANCPFFLQKLLGELCMSKPILPALKENWKIDETPFLPTPTSLKIKKEDGSLVTIENNKELQLACVTAYRKKHKEKLQEFDQPSTYSHLKVEPAKSVPQGGSLSPPLSTLGLEESIFKLAIQKIYELKEITVRVLMYADDGIFYWNKSMNLDTIFDEINLTLAPFGIALSLEKSGFVKKDGNWVRPLKFLGLTYDGTQNPAQLSSSTRSGASLPVSLELLEFVQQYELTKARKIVKESKYELSESYFKEHSDCLAKIRSKIKEIVKLRQIIESGGLAPRLTEYQIMARSELFGFIQNRLYQNSINLMPVKQNFSIFNELKGNSLIKIIMSTGSKLTDMDWNKITALLNVFNASTVASEILLKLLSETSLSSLDSYKKKTSWYTELRQFLNKSVRWHDLCPRIKLDKSGKVQDVTLRADYIAATGIKEKSVKVLLKRASLANLRRDQLLKRYSYFQNSTRKNIKLSKQILSELRLRHRILGVLDPAQYIKFEERSILIEMFVNTKFNSLFQKFKQTLKEYRAISLSILIYNKKYKCWIFGLDTITLSTYGLEPVVRPKTEEELTKIYQIVRTGNWIPLVEQFKKESRPVESKIFELKPNKLLKLISDLKSEERATARGKLKNKSGIYMWTSDNGKRYIGSSTNLWRRLLEYLNTNNLERHSYMSVCREMLDSGYSKFSYTLLEYCSPSELLNRENYYIDTFVPEYNETRALTRSEYVSWSSEQELLGRLMENKRKLKQNLLEPQKVTVKNLKDMTVILTPPPVSVSISLDELFLLKTKYPQMFSTSGELKLARTKGVIFYRWFEELTKIEKIHEILDCSHIETESCPKCENYFENKSLEINIKGLSLIKQLYENPQIYQNVSEIIKFNKSQSW